MELTKEQVRMTKGIAILFMLFLHLFCRKDIAGYYDVIFQINGVPLVYYISLLAESCIAMYCFLSGYGLFITYKNNESVYWRLNFYRLGKLYLNYWLILVLFVVCIGTIIGKEGYPGDLAKFVLAFTGIYPTYNGAWWFLTTYIFLVLASPFLFKLIAKHSIKRVIIMSFIIFFVAYLQNHKELLVVDNLIVRWLLKQICLFADCQFPFILGYVFADRQFYSRIYNSFNHLNRKNLFCYGIILAMLILHSFIESAFLAPFIAVPLIIILNLMDKPEWFNRLLSYLGVHSTNMWLTHMFFYLYFFKKLVFYPNYPIPIFVWLVVLCLGTSHLINLIYIPIVKKLEYDPLLIKKVKFRENMLCK